MGQSRVFGSFAPVRPHLIQGPGGQANEIEKVRSDVDAAFLALEKGGMIVKYFLNVSTDATLANSIKLQFASVAAPVVLTVADFDGILAPGTGAAFIRTPKKVTLTVGGGGTPADWLGGNVVVTGTSSTGAALSETVVSAAGAGTTTTVNYFATVTQVNLPAAGNTGAQLTLGTLSDTAAIASLVSAASAQVLDSPSEFNMDRHGNRVFRNARRISFVFNNNASWITSTITVYGTDIRGKPISDTIAVPNGGNGTVTTAKFFGSVTKITVPAQGGTAGTCAVGILNTEIGLDVDIISSVVAVSIIREANDPGTGVWAVPTAGTVAQASASNSAPYGKYTPNVPPDGVRSYVLAYLPNPA